MLKEAWTRLKIFLEHVANFQARLVLTLFYIVFVIPTGLIMQIFSDPLMLRRRSGSAWISKKSQENDSEYARRQF